MFKISTIEIPYNKLLARLGYLRAKTKLDKKTDTLIKEILDLAKKLIKVETVIAFENISIIDNEVLFENGYKIKSNNIMSLLKNSFRAYGIGVTIGSLLECKRDEFLKKKEIFNALILDAAGSVAVEEVIMLVNAQINIYEVKNGNLLTKRYSPGYGDWMLKCNKQFLNWIGAQYIGIKLSEFYQMKPEKSVSALIGVEDNNK